MEKTHGLQVRSAPGASCRLGLLGIVLTTLFLLPWRVAGFAYLVTFGDSYTDTWNLPSSPPDYWNGRFSNGPVWPEYLCSKLGFAYDQGNNFAISGSETDMLGIEISRFGGTSTPNDVLFAIWSGNNDFSAHLNTLGTSSSAWNTRISDTINSLSAACDLLYAKGARHIVIFNQLDITRLPQILWAYSSSHRSFIRSKLEAFNSQLNTALNSVRASHPGLNVYLADIYSGLNTLLDNASTYGFTKTTVGALTDPTLSDTSFTGPGANYVFWDGQHPTTKTHELIANMVAALVPNSPPPPPPPPPPPIINPPPDVGTLPSPWQQMDIGSVSLAGTAGISNSVLRVYASGSDIWDTADEFHFIYQTFSGDGQVILRVTSLDNTDGYAKAGLMLRQNLSAGSANVFEFVTPSGTPGFQSRSSDLATSTYVAGSFSSMPCWLKLVRSGTHVNGYASANGTDWVLTSSTSITLSNTLYAGVAVTSHNNSLLADAVGDQLQLLSATTPTNPPPIILPVRNPARLSVWRSATGVIRLTISGDTNATVRCETSADFKSWNPISTNLITTGSVQLYDFSSRTQQVRFYRAATL